MWQDLIDQKDKWIGGKIIDYGDFGDVFFGRDKPSETKIVDFKLTDDTIEFVGEDWPIKYNREYIGLSSIKVANGLALSGYAGHRIDIVKPTGDTT